MRGLFEQQLVTFPRDLHTSVKSVSKTLKLGKCHYQLFHEKSISRSVGKMLSKIWFLSLLISFSILFRSAGGRWLRGMAPFLAVPHAKVVWAFSFYDRFQGGVSDCKSIIIHLGHPVTFSSVFVDLAFNLVRPNFSTTPKKKLINPSVT